MRSSPVECAVSPAIQTALRSTCIVGCIVIVALMSAAIPSGKVHAQQAPVDRTLGSSSAPLDTRTPKGALWRALVIPGWGQVYNKQYAKLPFVYAAIGGLVYMAIQIDGQYRDYRRAYLYKVYQERVDAGIDDSNPWIGYKSSYDAIAAEYGQITSNPIRTQRDAYRRNRDLSFLASGLAYSLAVLDAFVSAHLLDFDVGESLSFNVNPAPEGVSLSARLSFQ